MKASSISPSTCCSSLVVGGVQEVHLRIPNILPAPLLGRRPDRAEPDHRSLPRIHCVESVVETPLDSATTPSESIRCIAGDLSSRATEEELIQFVRAEADDVDGPNLLGRQAGSPKSGPFLLQELLDLESRSWTVGMGWWADPTPASHHPLVKPNALGLKLSAEGTHDATRFDRRPPVGCLGDCDTGVLTDQPPSVTG